MLVSKPDSSDYNQVIKALREHGFVKCDGGKGSHEKWSKGKLLLIVPFNCTSRHTANGIMKDAGIDVKF